jgi:hypothetical protein
MQERRAEIRAKNINMMNRMDRIKRVDRIYNNQDL